jgi:His-Xaa-Ser system protein HxsD
MERSLGSDPEATSGLAWDVRNGRVVITLANDMFEKDAILAAAYGPTARCAVAIQSVDPDHIEVLLEPKSAESGPALEQLAQEFRNALVDHQLRLDLERRFGDLRSIIYEKAFAPLREDERRGE